MVSIHAGIHTLLVIALTGGPCSGKSLIIDALKRLFSGSAIFVPEMAEVLFQGGVIPLPGKHVPYSVRWQRYLQEAIYSMQVASEGAWGLSAVSQNIGIVFCDRGTLDGAAYWEGGREVFCDHFRTTPEHELGRYDLVVCLESLAVSQPELFESQREVLSNRYESLDETVLIDARTQEAWSGHPDFHYVRSMDTFGAKLDRVERIVRGFLKAKNVV